MNNSVGNDLLCLIQKDLQSVQLLCNAQITTHAAYHLQQAVEKFLKYILYCAGENIPIKTHNILNLLMKLDAHMITYPQELYVYALTISEWESQTRYDNEYVVNTNQIQLIYNVLVNYIIQKLGFDLRRHVFM